ncbi:MAG: MBL fold metallo-hydrolase [Paracoccaceae bacterium]
MFIRLAFLMVFLATAAMSQDRRPSHCIALANAAPGLQYVVRVGLQDRLAADRVRISYVDHSMFVIQTAGGLSVATDYTGFLGVTDFVPTVVTMNHAHSSHWTPIVPTGVAHILKGWGLFGIGIDHHLDLGEMLIRNVSTDIRGGFGGDEPNGNSIFVFEVAGLCIGHLGHLHHEPTDQQYAALGRLDVVFAAVDGGLTVPLPTMQRILKRLKSSVVIPMHWFGRDTLDRFLSGMADEFQIVRSDASSLEISLRNLPRQPTVIVLEPKFLE